MDFTSIRNVFIFHDSTFLLNKYCYTLHLPLSRGFHLKRIFLKNTPSIQLTTLVVVTRMFPVMKSIKAPVLKYHLRKIRKKNKL